MIEVQQLRKVYPGGTEAVKSIDFKVAPGEVFGLLGPNGAGKSSVIGMLTTTILPTGGSARVAGFDVVSDPIAARRQSGAVFQEAAVDRGLSGRRNLDIHARLWGLDRAGRAEIDSVVEAFGLTDVIARQVGTMSGGQRRRLEIARALITRPAVLFLDEPTVGLDPRIRFELLDVIAGLRASADVTVLLTTHYLDEAERLCDRVAIMHMGNIVALDTPDALLGQLGNELVELRVEANPEAALETLRSRRIAGPDAFSVGATVTVPLHRVEAHEAIAAISSLHLATAGISARRPTLDDVYLQLTGDRLAA